MCIKDNIRTIRNMVTEFTHGQMAVAMKATGSEESSMGWALTWSQKTAKLSLVFGRMASESNGLTKLKFRQ